MKEEEKKELAQNQNLPPLPESQPEEESSQPKELEEEKKPQPQKEPQLASCETKNSQSLIPEEVWQKKIEEAGVVSFKLEKAMTLPEVSIQIFGEESCWPKIWSFNPQIENPYELNKGDEIQFVNSSSRVPANSKK